MTTTYRAVRVAECEAEVWGIKGAWKTVNSTMGFYQSQGAAQAAIDRMIAKRRVVTVRTIPPVDRRWERRI